MAENRAGFEINGRFYPMPATFRLGDPVLVEELTGLEFPDFAERLGLAQQVPDADLDPVLTLGLIGVSIWQANPRWRRDKVVRYVQAIPQDDVEFQGSDDEDGPSPPAEPTADGSTDSVERSSTSPEDSPQEPTPDSSGAPGLDTTTPD